MRIALINFYCMKGVQSLPDRRQREKEGLIL